MLLKRIFYLEKGKGYKIYGFKTRHTATIVESGKKMKGTVKDRHCETQNTKKN